jgi:catechol 2,3-dioxygenase-like lactoylglutathione lyase family enzyme
VDWKLEVVVIPVTDVDRAIAFYAGRLDFTLDVDHRAGDFRVVQLTPPGSACSITLMANPGSAGTVQGLHLVVHDIDAALEQLAGHDVESAGPFHFGAGGHTDGRHPDRSDYGTFVSFSDPDGNGWLVQEVPSRAPVDG